MVAVRSGSFEDSRTGLVVDEAACEEEGFSVALMDGISWHNRHERISRVRLGIQ